MKRYALPALLAVSLSSVLAVETASAFGLGLQPSTVEMTIEEGDRQRQTITIGNVHKTKTISLQLGLADWSLDEDGQLILDAPGDTERSAAEWVRFSPATLTLKPETSADVTVEITTPYKVGTSGDHRFALLATTMLPELDERGGQSGVWTKYQLASLFYLTFQPSKSLPKVTSVGLDDAGDGKIRMRIENDGDAHARLQGVARVIDAAGETAGELEVNTVVLDQSSRNYTLSLPTGNLDAGAYTIDFDVDNVFTPQNGFKRMDVDIDDLEYVAR